MASRLRQTLPRLTLYSKAKDCSLCDDAKYELELFEKEFPHELKIVDITHPGNEVWFKRYKYHIPVLHFDGREVLRHRIDLTLLRKAIDTK